MIHKGLLTHDGVVPATEGKVLDLGFNGDFDIKNNAWNMVFVAFPANTNAAAITVAVKTAQVKDDIGAAAALASFVVPQDVAKAGGTFGIRMPMGLKRFFTLAITGGVATDKYTAGITDIVDTDVNPGVDWTNYKAKTKDVCQPGLVENVMGLDARVKALEEA